MSSLYVRQKVEGWLNDAAMTTPFYPTINEEQDPTDPIWVTADFDSAYREVLAFCDGEVKEVGDVELVYQAPPGVGYTALLTAVEADIKTLMAQRDPLGKLILINRSAPFEYSNGDADLNYEVAITVEYNYYE